MPIYINKERPHDYGSSEREKARAKAEKYESMRVPFVEWATQVAKTDPLILQVGYDKFVAAGLEEIENLVNTWMEIYDGDPGK